MEPRYRVVFTGSLVPGKDVGDVIAAFAKRFKLSESTARAVLASGGSQVLKRALERERAERYRATLHQVGMVVDLVPETGGFSPEVAPSPNPEWPARGPLPGPKAPLAAAGAQVSSPIAAQPDTQPFAAGPNLVKRAPASVEQADRRVREGEARSAAPRLGAAAAAVGEHPPHATLGARHRAETNPYAPPQADLTPPAPEPEDAALHPPRPVSAGRGFGWIADAWALFAAQPGAWIGGVLIVGVVYVVLNLLPLVGPLAGSLISPVFTAGLMLGAHAQHGGGRFAVQFLSAGFTRRPGRLLLLGVAYLAMALGIGVAVVAALAALFAGAGLAIEQSGLHSGDPGSAAGPALLPVLLSMLFVTALAIPMAMALFFAPALVAIGDLPVGRALKQSFLGCWRNMLPFLLFCLAAFLVVLVASIPLLLGLLVAMPLLTIAVYIAFRDIYLD